MKREEALKLALDKLQERLWAVEDMVADKENTAFILAQQEYWAKQQARLKAAIKELEKMERGE